MTATVYGRGQMVIPSKARKAAGINKGDVMDVQPEGDGRILLVRLERPKHRLRKMIITRRRGRHPVATSGNPITSDQVRALLDEP